MARRVVIAGLGNIGSPLVPLVARMPAISSLGLVDGDAYTEANLTGQSIDRSAVGRPKVDVQAEHVAAIAPELHVETFCERIENVPAGYMRDSILVSCVDSRRSRQTISRIAGRFGSPWLDAAVGAPSLARVTAYAGGEGAPCIECTWDDSAYALLEQEYACREAHRPTQSEAPATAAPAELGSIAASLLAAKLREQLDADPDAGSNSREPFGRQVMLDTCTYALHLNRFARSEDCRFDHEVRAAIEPLPLDPDESTLADLFTVCGADPESSLGLDGQRFTTELSCVVCGEARAAGLVLVDRLDGDMRTCRCGGRLYANGFLTVDSLRRAGLSAHELGRRLTDVGFRRRDIVSVTTDGKPSAHFEVGIS